MNTVVNIQALLEAGAVVAAVTLVFLPGVTFVYSSVAAQTPGVDKPLAAYVALTPPARGGEYQGDQFQWEVVRDEYKYGLDNLNPTYTYPTYS